MSHSFFGVKKNFFKNKVCLDAASGINLNATLNLLNLGAKYVYACDFNPKLKKINKGKFKPFIGKYEVRLANLKKLPYENNYFDFVHCAGAIHHTTNYKKSINELCRVTKNGGYIYLEAYGTGGIIREITTFLREKVNKDLKFKKEVINLNKKKITKFINYLTNNRYKKNINKLFDDDLVLTIKDRLLSPLYIEFSDKDIVNILKKTVFIKSRDLKEDLNFQILENIFQIFMKITIVIMQNFYMVLACPVCLLEKKNEKNFFYCRSRS